MNRMLDSLLREGLMMNYVVSDWKLFARLGHWDIGTLG